MVGLVHRQATEAPSASRVEQIDVEMSEGTGLSAAPEHLL